MEPKPAADLDLLLGRDEDGALEEGPADETAVAQTHGCAAAVAYIHCCATAVA